MLDITVTATDPLEADVDVLVVPAYKGGIEGPGTEAVLAALGVDGLPVTPQFRGDTGQHLLLAAPGLRARGILLVGLGRVVDTTPERLRRAAGVAARAAGQARTLATTLAQVHPTAASVQAVAEGLWLGAATQRNTQGRDTRGGGLEAAEVLVPASRTRASEQAVARARHYTRATLAARDLVDLPAGHKTPARLAAAVADLTAPACEVTTVQAAELAASGYGGLLAAGQGSAHPPCLVELAYQPPRPLGRIVLAGTAVTFASGGLALRAPRDLVEAKAAMAGCAAVAGACAVLADLGVRLEVTALLPMVEQLPGADALRPGDVVTTYGGTRVEVADVAAVWTLALADVLARARELDPDAVVDVSVGSGAAIPALGRYTAALQANDDELRAALLAAAELAGEAVWPLPAGDDLDRFLASQVADVRNTAVDRCADPGGQAVADGRFLQRVVGDVPWAHMDITGPACLPRELAHGYLRAGGTGVGVRTLLAWLERRAE